MSIFNPDTFAITPALELFYDLVLCTLLLYWLGLKNSKVAHDDLLGYQPSVTPDSWLVSDDEVVCTVQEPNYSVITEPVPIIPEYYPAKTIIDGIVANFSVLNLKEPIVAPLYPLYTDNDTTAFLKNVARKAHLRGYSKMNKAQLIQALNNLPDGDDNRGSGRNSF